MTPSDNSGALILSALQGLQLMQQLRDALLDIVDVPWSALQIDIYFVDAESNSIDRLIVHTLPGYWKEAAK
jgi:hypothetical protein